MNTVEKINSLLEIDDSYKAPNKLMKILFDKEKREELFRKFLDEFDYDVAYDWFNEYFQEEHADRKKLKQDFTPASVGKLMSKLIEDDGFDYYEVCCGTGSILIQHWNNQRLKTNSFDYLPSDYFHTVEELSDRAIPFLIFNIAIRGMNGVVVHCDSLSRKSKGAFFIQNFNDNHLGFSDINVLPYYEYVERELSVKFTEKKYPEHIERARTPEEIIETRNKMRS
ncbi:N-6 DNA methylase [Tissierella sp.]|uniref:N-6 DNA methylase n=1 Tax=Tissierella sp. TaxID=41274 RepID=UPI0028B0C062|nr:N-6 DNA methylase [Tissierella sp.]